MNALLTLVKKDITLDFGVLLNPAAALHNKKMRNQLLLALFSFVVFGAYIFFFMKFFLGLLPAFLEAGLGEAFLASTMGLFSVMLVVFTVAPLVSRLYFSNDIKIMQTLPLSASTILGSKILGTTGQGMLISVILVFPMIIKYGWTTGQGVLFYVSALLGIVALTIFTVSLLSLAVIAFMRVATRIPNFKAVLQFLGMALTIAVALGIQLLTRDWVESQADNLLQTGRAVMDVTYTFFPHVRLFTRTLLAEGAADRLLFLASLAVPAALIAYFSVRLGAGIMMRGIADNRVVARRRRSKTKQDDAVRSTASWIARKDVLDIIKTPIYFFNIGMFGLLFPLILLVPFLANREAMEGIGMLNRILDRVPLNTLEIVAISALAGFVINFFLGTTAQTALTTFTREGKNIWLMQSLPISYRDQVEGRLRASVLFQTVSGLPIFAMLLFVLRPGWIWMAGYIVGGAVAVLFTSRMGLLVDINKPKLGWDNPQRAVKQNANVFVATMGGMIYIGLLGYFTYQLGMHGILTPQNAAVVGVVLLVLHLVVAVILKGKCVRLLEQKLATYNAGE